MDVMATVFGLLIILLLGAVVIVFCLGLILAAKERWQVYKWRGLAAALGKCVRIRNGGVSYLAEKLGGTAWRVPEGVVIKFGSGEHLVANEAKAVGFLRDYESEARKKTEITQVVRSELGERPPVSQNEPGTQEDEARGNESRENKRPIRGLAVWYAMCLTVVAAWFFLLGGPHSYLFSKETSYGSRFRWDRRFFWDSFEFAGIAWFATTLIYALLARNLEPREGATKPPSA